ADLHDAAGCLGRAVRHRGRRAARRPHPP
ncbi:MAG: hypothetical protein AVDCRST_MAG79-2236, partial [uncultured Thermoleophilia bacterium]